MIGSDAQQSRLSPSSRCQLTAHVVRAVRLPQGLVLWPDSPCLRLTTLIDGRKSDMSDEVLQTVEGVPSSSMTREAKSEGAEENTEANAEAIEVLSGHKAHVLVLQLPVTTLPLPDVSLQLEVVVGRVVTARVCIDLTEMVTASLALKSETSSGRHTSVKLPNGGEVTLTLDIGRVIYSDVDERDVKSPRLPRGAGESEADRIQFFLHSIASWGHEDTTTTTLDRDSIECSSIDKANRQPGSGSADPEKGNYPTSSIGEGLGSGADRYKSAFSDLAGWLASSHPDPVFLRTALEKTGNYSFPKVEAPFMAALLQHGGLVGEALRAVEVTVATREQGKGVQAIMQCSMDMVLLRHIFRY